MKRFLNILFLFAASMNLSAQWEKHPIVINEFQDTNAPIWLDLNNDGFDDLLGYDEDTFTFFWRENNGSKFLNPKGINDGSNPIKNKIYTTGDWDQDGDIDILAHLSSSSSFEINGMLLSNNGDGTFVKSTFSFESEQFFGEISQFGDFNHDGFADIIVNHSSNYYVYLFSNGTYESIGYNLNTSSYLSTQLYILDIDGDGLQEILEIDKYFNINFHEWNNNTLSISKSIAVVYPGSQNYSASISIEFIDLDFDGDLDILRSIQDYDLIAIGDIGTLIVKSRYLYQHIQDENKNFSSTGVYVSQPLGDSFSYATIADKLNEQYSLAIFEGSNYSEWTFQNGAFQLNFNGIDEIPQSSNGVLSSQFLFNTNQENLVTLNMNDFSINAGYRSLVPEEVWSWDNCINCSALNTFEDIEPVDIDGDGDLDLVISDPKNKNQLVWIENYNSGCHFENVNNILGQYFEATSITIESADFDNDGDNDLLLKTDVDEAELFVLKNDGAGNFSNPIFLANIPYGVDLYTEDIYQDGFAEVIIHTGRFSFTTQDTSTFTTTILNNLNGIENFNIETFQNTTDSGQIDFNDIDFDGDTDMIVYNDDAFNESIVIYTNDGNKLNQSQIHEEFIDMYGLNIFDFDRDNYPDIMVFQDGLSNNNISTLYRYNNNQGSIEFESPDFIFENIDRYQHLGVHNPDGSLGFVSKTGFGTNGVLVYYTQSGILDTLDQLNPDNYLLEDLNNDGYNDIIVADEKGGLNFYTLGLIDCMEPCLPDTEGYLYFTDCNSIEYFVIETTEGEILDPYFDTGVNFNIMDGQYVRFSYTDFEIETPCDDVKTILIQCIEEYLYIPLLSDYPWVENLIDQSSGCCEIVKIEAYYNDDSRYIYVTPRADCQEFRERLYDENELLLCIEPEQANNECITAYGLDQLDKTILYQCNPVANENIFDESLIDVFPNPSNDVFNINTELNGKLKILNAQGKYLKQYKQVPASIDLNLYDSGLYFLSFEHKGQRIIKKVVKL